MTHSMAVAELCELTWNESGELAPGADPLPAAASPTP
jgi:hypothetical protein